MDAVLQGNQENTGVCVGTEDVIILEADRRLERFQVCLLLHLTVLVSKYLSKQNGVSRGGLNTSELRLATLEGNISCAEGIGNNQY